MPILENKIEQPAEKLAKTLQEFNLRIAQERLKQEEINRSQEKENKLFNNLNSNQLKIQELINSQLNTLSLNQSKLQELVDFQQGKENEKFRFLANQIIALNNHNIEAIKQIKINYKDLLGRPKLLTIKDIDDRLVNIIDKQETILLIQQFLKRLKIDFQDLLNKPDILTEDKVNDLIVDYSTKIKNLLQVDLKISNVKIEEINVEHKKIKELIVNLNQEINFLKEENKKISSKANVNPYAYRDTVGYDYGTVKMSKMIFITSNYPASSVDFGIMANATSGAITITLPSAIKTGQVLSIKKIDSSANAITIVPSGTETIEGASSIILSAQYESRWLVAGGNSVWYSVSATGAAGIGTETPVGAKNGVNVTYTVSHIPSFLNLNGQIFYEGSGYSRSGLVLTIDLAPNSTDLFKSHY